MRLGLRADSYSFLPLRLGSLMTMIGLVIFMPKRYAFMRPTSLVVFDFPSIRSSESFSSFATCFYSISTQFVKGDSRLYDHMSAMMGIP